MDSLIKLKLAEYPMHVQERLMELHNLILDVASSLGLGPVDQSLKWGEVSYSVKTGSPIRIDWKRAYPDHYFMYFNCQTKLVDTFRVVYGEHLVLQSTRAIVLSLSETLPRTIITHCIELALTYKLRKNLPLLGI
ncbi:hypothetical protein [Pseudoalteromonas luteoviolacea]|uniref:YdhG-like domain-containing protein n=1 Tax=Pseudoalteromonas luteoviolacea S4060-1 TaxID=1365257 RepID=A0A167JN77_9GAMM|nr:hypothetical protein [Pseudoalteromonas luteoviolacea]KZN61401.1 hypothetical protein N478_04860 [Pseudoalteromonas luteoviolacea S4060-1]